MQACCRTIFANDRPRRPGTSRPTSRFLFAYGFSNELDNLYRSAAALVFPSEYEGFGNPVVEAMARGCPVITTDATALPEVAGDAGLIVPFSNTPGQAQHYFAALGPASMLFETSTASTTIAAFLGGSGNLSELIEQAEDAGVDVEGITDLDIDIDVAPFPGIEEAGRVAISGGAYYMTDTGSEAQRAAAWEFMKFVNEVEQQKIIHLKGSYLPISSAVRAVS